MEPDTLFPLKRQKELIRINRMLAIFVVLLTFSTGYLLSLNESWLATKHVRQPIPSAPLAASGSALPLVSHPSPLTALLTSARYERVLTNTPISKMTLETILWSAQGTITPWGERTVPSYKSAFPLTLFVLVRQVTDIPPGWYRFNAEKQSIEPTALASTLLLPEVFPGLRDASAVIFTLGSQTDAAEGMVWNEAGGIAQNILLAVRENQLATFLIPGTYLDTQNVGQVFGAHQSVYWFMPIGKAKEK